MGEAPVRSTLADIRCLGLRSALEHTVRLAACNTCLRVMAFKHAALFTVRTLHITAIHCCLMCSCATVVLRLLCLRCLALGTLQVQVWDTQDEDSMDPLLNISDGFDAQVRPRTQQSNQAASMSGT